MGGRGVHAHKDTPNSRGVFNHVLPIRKASTTWPSAFASSALTDWVGLFSHHDNGSNPINVNNGKSAIASFNPSNLMVVGSFRALSRLRPCNIPMSGVYLSFCVLCGCASHGVFNSTFPLYPLIDYFYYHCFTPYAFISLTYVSPYSYSP